ncbi:hypothetical protein DICVIV_10892 [Dictyocaulus viviparus]|uniref:Tetraspanin family protein n=1 Tax=Dictyocaulus viviparus TaxID=29172 RepID=A0A0D8XET2_DICVI|nr:hypothetical protein DICVIV_10892 [Dictyocaulus viviparus]
MVILATEIAAAIYAAMHSHMFENDFREILRASLRLYNGTNNNHKDNVDGMLMKAAWDKLMVEKNCCGVDSKIGEFNESGWFHLTKGRYMFPSACCPPDPDGKLKPICHLVQRHKDGCYDKIAESFHELTSHFKIVSWTVVFIALIQGCIVHMFFNNRLQFSAIFGVFFVSCALQLIGCTISIAMYRRVKIEMLYYY